ncbi:MAG: PAS domain S-box protein [Candidatus Zixiibacteriota bacterium]|nr:MAG: PAS domain S-box protein [candidate division Zixibacteria bacterium]
MLDRTNQSERILERRVQAIVAIIISVAVFALTWVGIRKSRADSYQLLVNQGAAFTEALAQASQNAIVSETFYDYFVQKRYADLVAVLTDMKLDVLTEQDLLSFVLAHDLYSVAVYDSSIRAVAVASSESRGSSRPKFVDDEVAALFASPEVDFVLLTDEGETSVETIHYYLQMNSRFDRVVVLSCDAGYHTEALQQTGIGYLAQNMAGERGVEYIIYQSTEGIIFASRRLGNMLAIESDPFLSQMLDSDTIASRQFEFQGQTVLELVRPFSTRRFPFGLFRVGLSLDSYYAVSRGLTYQMLILSAVLVCFLLVAILYLNSRARRKELKRKYTRIKTVTDRMFEQMRTGVAAIDRAGSVLFANGAFERIFGLGDSLGKRWSDIVPASDMNHEEFISGRQESDETELRLNVTGEDRYLLVARSQLVDKESETDGVVVVVYDITRMKEFEALSTRRQRLSEMGNLAAGVAHEIRNPLNTIAVAAQRLASEFSPAENEDEYQSFTQKIRNETTRLNEIITRFLALSRDEQKKQTPVDLEDFLSQLTGLWKVEAETFQAELELDVEDGLIIEADPDRLKQLFHNLFNNAREALDGKPGHIAITGNRDQDVARIVFSDSGPGIPEDLRDRVVTPYFTTKDAGTGLGLPTVHQIITDLNGDMTISESRWGGAAIVLRFPLSKAS